VKITRRKRGVAVTLALGTLSIAAGGEPATCAPERVEGGNGTLACVIARVFLCHGRMSCPALPRGCYLNLPSWGL